jgi:hypothetical protein
LMDLNYVLRTVAKWNKIRINNEPIRDTINRITSCTMHERHSIIYAIL